MNTKSNEIAEIDVRYKTSIAKESRITICNSNDAFKYLQNSWNKDIIELQEEFKVLLLNNNNEVLGLYNLSKGTTNGVNVDIKLIFAVALKACASAIIIAHNHPSGNLKPSKSDQQLTKKIKEASDFLDIKLLDHLILTKEGFLSFSDERLVE